MRRRRRRSVDNLFSDRSIHEHRRKLEQQMRDEVKDLSNNELHDSTDLLTLIFTSTYTPSPIQLYDYSLEQAGEVEKEIRRDQGLPGLDRSGRVTETYQRIRVKLPLDGDRSLLQIKPSSSKLNKPRYNELNRNEVVYYVDYTIGNKDADAVQAEIQSEVDDWVDKVTWFVDQLNGDFEDVEEKLRRTARRAIENRRETVDTNQAVMTGLGVDTGDPTNPGYVVPEKKREIELPSPSEESGDDVLADQTFIEVLDLLDDLGQDLERSATPVRDLEEEAIRDIFLMGINSHYAGFATGETFNRGGKSDILLRYGNANLFVAECKFWDGRAVYGDAVDQLLNNVTVRDSHTALLIFSRRQDFGMVQERMREATEDHDRYLSAVPEIADHDVYRLESASGHPVRVAIKAFDLG